MAKRSNSTQSDNVKLGIDPEQQLTYNLVTNKLGSTVIRYGSYSGRKYTWGAGESILVQHEDAVSLKNLKLGERTCCGSGTTNTMFEVSEE